MNDKTIVKNLAREVMHFADKRSYGLGECRWNLNKWALDEIKACNAYVGFDDAYDAKLTGDDACTGDHEVHLKQAKSLANEVYNLACELSDLGVTTFE